MRYSWESNWVRCVLGEHFWKVVTAQRRIFHTFLSIQRFVFHVDVFGFVSGVVDHVSSRVVCRYFLCPLNFFRSSRRWLNNKACNDLQHTSEQPRVFARRRNPRRALWLTSTALRNRALIYGRARNELYLLLMPCSPKPRIISCNSPKESRRGGN